MIGSLIIYSSTDGHTKTICKRIIDFLEDGNIKSFLEVKNVTLKREPKIAEKKARAKITIVTGINNKLVSTAIGVTTPKCQIMMGIDPNQAAKELALR